MSEPLASLGFTRPAWQRDALCLEYPDLPWVPIGKQSVAECLAVCGRCAVRAECLAWAMADPTLDNAVLGGCTGDVRRNRRRLERQR